MLSPASDSPYPFIYDARFTRAMRDTYLGPRSFDQGSGVFMAVATLAKELGVSESTAHRHIRKLNDHGVLEVKPQFQDGQQRTNFYLFPNPQWWVEGGCQSDTLIEIDGGVETSCLPEITVFSSQEQQQATPTTTGVGVARAAEGGTGGGAREVGGGGGFRWRTLADLYLAPLALVQHFEDLVKARQVREKGKLRKIPDDRRVRWCRDARTLTDRHPPDELRSTITWLFSQHHGYLPFPVVNEYTGRSDPRERRVTRLAQVLDHYQELREFMNRGKPSLGSPETPPTGVEQEVVVVQEVEQDIRPEGRWDLTGLSDLEVEESAVEDQVSVLVELFRKTRRHPVSDFDVFSWRKTFSIMLTHHQIPYDDIRLVVNALGNHRLELDFARYHSPYDLHRNGEWPYVLGAVQIALLREKNLPTPAPPPPPPDDDDEFYRQLGEEFGT